MLRKGALKHKKKLEISSSSQLTKKELIEFQGELKTRPDPNANKEYHILGSLQESQGKGKHIFIIGRKKLLGKTVNTRKKFLFLKKVSHDKHEIVSVSSKKLLFRTRPTPIECTPTTPIVHDDSKVTFEAPKAVNMNQKKKKEFLQNWKSNIENKKKKKKKKKVVQNSGNDGMGEEQKKAPMKKKAPKKKVNPFGMMMKGRVRKKKKKKKKTIGDDKGEIIS